MVSSWPGRAHVPEGRAASTVKGGLRQTTGNPRRHTTVNQRPVPTVRVTSVGSTGHVPAGVMPGRVAWTLSVDVLTVVAAVTGRAGVPAATGPSVAGNPACFPPPTVMMPAGSSYPLFLTTPVNMPGIAGKNRDVLPGDTA